MITYNRRKEVAEGTDAGKYDDGYESKEEYDDPLYNDIVDFAMEFGKNISLSNSKKVSY